MSRGTKVVIGLVLVLGSVAAGVWGFMEARARMDRILGLEDFEMTSNQTRVLALEGGVTYVIAQNNTQPVDQCDVLDPEGRPIAVKKLDSAGGGYQEAYSFTTGESGGYSVTCAAKADGRYVEVQAKPSASFSIVMIAGCALVFVIGLVLLDRSRKPKRDS